MQAENVLNQRMKKMSWIEKQTLLSAQDLGMSAAEMISLFNADIPEEKKREYFDLMGINYDNALKMIEEYRRKSNDKNA